MKDAASFFKVLADEARLKMLWLLFNRRELCVCDFIEVLEITQSKASRHLRVLYNAGLVTDRKEGLWSYYTLRPPQDELVGAQMEVLRARLKDRPDAEHLLRKLHVWLEQKNRGAKCAGIAARPSSTRPARAAHPAAPMKGGH